MTKFICCFIFVIILVSSGDAKRDRIKLKDIETLTLYANQWTTARRSPPVKQLNCIGGYCRQAKISTAQCYNRGYDGQNVQWECKAEMPSNFKFGNIEISCEGYDHSDDDYVLYGSCGLEYTIDQIADRSYDHYNFYKKAKQATEEYSSFPVVIFIITALMGFIYYMCLSDNTRHHPSPSAPPPPPPGFRSDFYPSGDSHDSGSNCNRQNQTGGGLGFGSGLAAGSLLGYLFGSSRANQGYSSGYTHMPYQTYTTTDTHSRHSPHRASSSQPSSSTHTSSGFGTTKRR